MITSTALPYQPELRGMLMLTGWLAEEIVTGFLCWL